MSYRGRDWEVFSDILAHGPSVPKQIIARTQSSQGAVKAVIRKLQRSGHLTIAGHAPRAHGQVGRLPYIVDIGPRVRAWAVRTIKPKED